MCRVTIFQRNTGSGDSDESQSLLSAFTTAKGVTSNISVD